MEPETLTPRARDMMLVLYKSLVQATSECDRRLSAARGMAIPGPYRYPTQTCPAYLAPGLSAKNL